LTIAIAHEWIENSPMVSLIEEHFGIGLQSDLVAILFSM
jgi:hypothetical protein